jgi:hypothetical protein
LRGNGIGQRAMRGVSGSLRLPNSTQATTPEASLKTKLDITLVDGPELDKEFDTTIYFDVKDFEAGSRAGRDGEGVATPGRFIGRVVLPDSVHRSQLVSLARLISSPEWPTALSQQDTAEPERVPEPDSDTDSDRSLAPTNAETVTTDATSV